MRPYVEEMHKICDVPICIYPNAGLPNPMAPTGFDETPEITSGLISEFAKEGWINIVGGCCGTTPEHIAAIKEKVRNFSPRVVPEIEKNCDYLDLSRAISEKILCLLMLVNEPT